MNEQIDVEQLGALCEIGNLTNEGLIIFNLSNKKFIFINPVARGFLGIGNEPFNLHSDALLQLVIPEDQEYVKRQFELITEKFSKVDIEFRLHSGEKQTDIVICCNAYLIMNRNYLVASLRDITKAKEHENYLVEFGIKKNTLLDTLMHHISGALLLMQHLTLEAEKSVQISNSVNVTAYLELLNDNSEHCITIINNLLEDENTESPKIFVKRSRIDLVENVRYIFDSLRQTYSEKKFSFSASSPSIYVNTDEFKLLQIVNNFISNAVKFTPENGKIEIALAEKGNEVIVRITDNGMGIPENLQPFIFERRFSGRIGTRGEKSTGLGLSINKKLTDVLGGQIWYESIPGKGSSFYFSLPIQ